MKQRRHKAVRRKGTRKSTHRGKRSGIGKPKVPKLF